MSIEELIDAQPSAAARKRGPAAKRQQQQLERINALPKAKQKLVMQALETVLQPCRIRL